MVLTKICGLTTDEAVEAALEGGADFVGFVVFAPSPRHREPAAAARLAAPARGRARIVAVTVDPDDRLLEIIAAELAPDLIQLHGAESPSRVRQIGERFGTGVIKALPVSETADLAAAAPYAEVADHLMFDARAPAELGRPGGAGASFDWTLLAGFATPRPWFLAGGLTPANVAAAVRACGAPATDVSSGVEQSAGLKDPALIRAFLSETARA